MDSPCSLLSCGCSLCGAEFSEGYFAVSTLGDPELPITSAPQVGLMCQCSEVWGAVKSLSARG